MMFNAVISALIASPTYWVLGDVVLNIPRVRPVMSSHSKREHDESVNFFVIFDNQGTVFFSNFINMSSES